MPRAAAPRQLIEAAAPRAEARAPRDLECTDRDAQAMRRGHLARGAHAQGQVELPTRHHVKWVDNRPRAVHHRRRVQRVGGRGRRVRERCRRAAAVAAGGGRRGRGGRGRREAREDADEADELFALRDVINRPHLEDNLVRPMAAAAAAAAAGRGRGVCGECERRAVAKVEARRRRAPVDVRAQHVALQAPTERLAAETAAAAAAAAARSRLLHHRAAALPAALVVEEGAKAADDIQIERLGRACIVDDARALHVQCDEHRVVAAVALRPAVAHAAGAAAAALGRRADRVGGGAVAVSRRRRRRRLLFRLTLESDRHRRGHGHR